MSNAWMKRSTAKSLSAPDEMKPFLAAQMKMQQEQQLSEWITKMLKGDHDQATTVLRNVGG